MPCPEYEKLTGLLESRRSELNYFHPVNEDLHGPAKKAKQLFNAAQAEVIKLQRTLLAHKSECKACKNALET
jgi:hypothetical protein